MVRNEIRIFIILVICYHVTWPCQPQILDIHSKCSITFLDLVTIHFLLFIHLLGFKLSTHKIYKKKKQSECLKKNAETAAIVFKCGGVELLADTIFFWIVELATAAVSSELPWVFRNIFREIKTWEQWTY